MVGLIYKVPRAGPIYEVYIYILANEYVKIKLNLPRMFTENICVSVTLPQQSVGAEWI